MSDDDAKRRESHERDLEHDHQARTMWTGGRRHGEPRLARDDEDRMARQAKQHHSAEKRAHVGQLLSDMHSDLENVRALMPSVVEGVDCRNPIRAIANGIRTLNRLLER